MNFIFSILIVVFIVLLLFIFAAWLYRFGRKDNEEFIDKAIDKVSSLIDSKMSMVADQRESCPWYLVVYTKDSNYPIWISNNTIRSVHPDPEHCKIIVKQFNGEDMVIENVINYDMRTANKLFDYEM